MKRFFGAVAVTLLLVASAALGALGGLGLAVFGRAGATTSASEPLASSSESVAIVADIAGVEVDLPGADRLGVATLTATAGGGRSVFLGTGPQASVDEYLFAVPYDLASKSGAWSTTPVPGIEQVAADPRDQTFWTERSLGSSATIELPQAAGAQTLVIMNADGSPGVAVDLALGFRGERIFWYSLAAVLLGVAGLLVGFALLLRGRRRRRRGREQDLVDLSAPTATAVLVESGPAEAPDGDPPPNNGRA